MLLFSQVRETLAHPGQPLGTAKVSGGIATASVLPTPIKASRRTDREQTVAIMFISGSEAWCVVRVGGGWGN